MDELIDYQCIDFQKLLILKAKKMQINDEECYLLLLIMTLNEIGVKPITPSQISRVWSLSIQKIDDILMSLVDKHWISRRNGSLNLKPLQNLLLEQPETQETTDIDLVSIFEDAFGRSLSQREIQLINSLKCQGYGDEMIVDALNESVKSGVITFRYIEKILDNWSRYGVTKRFAPQSSPSHKQEVEQSIKDYKWWEENE